MRKAYLLLSLVLLLSFSVNVQAGLLEDVITGLMIIDDETAARLIGEIGDNQLGERPGFSQNNEALVAVKNVVRRLAQTPTTHGYQFDFRFKILNSSKINAYALPGGRGYLTRGLVNVNGISQDELAFVIAHEMGHIVKKHSLKKFKETLIASKISEKVFGKKKVWAEIAETLYISGRSQKAEWEADDLAFQSICEADYNPKAGLTFMRRLETISRDNMNPLEELFSTHPSTKERSENLKDRAIAYDTGGLTYKEENTKEEFAQTTVASENTSGWKSEAGLKAYQKATGWPVYRTGNNNRYTEAGFKGQCTWFAYAVTKDIETGGHGADWLEAGRKAGYATGKEPKPHSIVVWDKDLNSHHDPNGNGWGHVGMVWQVAPSGNFRVWDSNWLMDEKVRCHLITNRDHIKGFVYLDPSDQQPKNKPSKPEEQSTSQERPKEKKEDKTVLREKVVISRGPHHLGDDEIPLETAWWKEFKLSKEETEAKNAYLSVEVRGVPMKDPIFSFNRKEIATVITRTDEWESYEFHEKTPTLKENNLADVETVITDLYDSYDDCQFRNLILHLEY